jgi:hypothetical protein
MTAKSGSELYFNLCNYLVLLCPPSFAEDILDIENARAKRIYFNVFREQMH